MATGGKRKISFPFWSNRPHRASKVGIATILSFSVVKSALYYTTSSTCVLHANMSSTEFSIITEAVIASIKPSICKTSCFILIYQYKNSVNASPVEDEDIQKLRSFFPDTLILAALDLVDRDSGKLTYCSAQTPSGHIAYACVHRAHLEPN